MRSLQTLLRTALRPRSAFNAQSSVSMASVRHGSTLSSYLVTPADANASLQRNASDTASTAPRTIALCASWFLPNDAEQRTGAKVFREAHIPGARFFDLDRIADTSSPYPHMLPSAQVFRDAMRVLGIRRHDTIVVYDTKELGIFSAPRVAWTLSIFGHPAVHVLNNFKLYVENGYPVEKGEQAPTEPSDYPLPELDRARVVEFEEMKSTVQDYDKDGKLGVQVLDARSFGRWQGVDPEPRKGLSSGHMPGSISVPLPELLDPVTKALLPRDRLREVFNGKGINSDKPIVASCGTGVTAAVVDAALREAGLGDGSRRIYDGSWTEWAQRVSLDENLIVHSK